jgi:hypothetical protein
MRRGEPYTGDIGRHFGNSAFLPRKDNREFVRSANPEGPAPNTSGPPVRVHGRFAPGGLLPVHIRVLLGNLSPPAT